MSERESFGAALARFERELGREIDRLAVDAQRLRARGNPRFAAELLELRDRLHGIRVYAEVLLAPAKAPPPLPTADVWKPGAA